MNSCRPWLETVIFLARLITGIVTGSLSLVALAMFTGADIFRAFAGLMQRYQAPSVPQDKPPFGFNKIPALVKLAGGAALIVGAIYLFRTAGRKMELAPPVGNYYPAIAVLAVTILVLGFVAARPGAAGTKQRPFNFGLLISLGVLAMLLVAQFTGFVSTDPVIAIIVLILGLLRAASLLLEAVKEFMDNRLPRHEEQWIEGFIREYGGSRFEVQDLQARMNGAKRWIDFHLKFNSHIDEEQAFNVANDLEKELMKKVPGAIVIIHVKTGKE